MLYQLSNTEQLADIEELHRDNASLRNMVEALWYAPGGPVYQEAAVSFTGAAKRVVVQRQPRVEDVKPQQKAL